MVKSTTINDALIHAKKERAELGKKLRALNQTIEYLQGLLKIESDAQMEMRGLMNKNSNRFENMTAAQAARTILLEHKEPMPLKRIAQIMIEGGYKGYKPYENVRNLYTTLYSILAYQRIDLFKKSEDYKATFGLREWEKEKEKP
ncbi:winged helix-turn-helix domain-containing protein [bacterium]|nr:winged helix-turn-helix domain-containing protein [bacterium]